VVHDPNCALPSRDAIAHDYVGWGKLIGRLAQDFPQLVAFGIDDYGNHPESISAEDIAQMQSNMRSQAPWLNFVPIAYASTSFGSQWPDLSRTLDTFIFYFRNEMTQLCLGDGCAQDSVPNLPTETAFMKSLLPKGRRLQLGTYWVTLWEYNQTPNTLYDYRLAGSGLADSTLGGVTAYSMQGGDVATCNDFDYLNIPFCTLWKTFGANGSCTPGQIEQCGLCGTHTCATNFTFGACVNQGGCTPGSTRTVACGTNGTEIDTCGDNCQWQLGTCGCTPGAVRSCCPCGSAGCGCAGEQTCTSPGVWGSCSGYVCKPLHCP